MYFKSINSHINGFRSYLIWSTLQNTTLKPEDIFVVHCVQYYSVQSLVLELNQSLVKSTQSLLSILCWASSPCATSHSFNKTSWSTLFSPVPDTLTSLNAGRLPPAALSRSPAKASIRSVDRGLVRPQPEMSSFSSSKAEWEKVLRTSVMPEDVIFGFAERLRVVRCLLKGMHLWRESIIQWLETVTTL